jgi:glycine oxidase
MPSVSTAPPDIAVIGGGIVGLWTAYRAARQGLSVVLLEKRTPGAGASGGVMGALMPHQPTSWNEKKQFQLEALLTLETEVADLETFTGLSAGYRRCGRIMPIRHAEKRRQSAAWAEASHDNWPDPYRWRVTDETPAPDFLPQIEMPFGANTDNLSARIDPRRLSAALTAALRRLSVTICENTGVAGIETDGTLHLANGETLTPGHAVLAAGWESFALVADRFSGPVGQGVKGQAALLRPAKPLDASAPILYDNGTYVIVHDTGDVAIGSTSENEFSDPGATDEKLDAVIASAQALCPALQNAEVLERWAGIRPKAAGREPLAGPLQANGNVWIATGGFKIGLAIAHRMADGVLMQIAGEQPDFLPDIFLPENRLRTSVDT